MRILTSVSSARFGALETQPESQNVIRPFGSSHHFPNTPYFCSQPGRPWTSLERKSKTVLQETHEANRAPLQRQDVKLQLEMS